MTKLKALWARIVAWFKGEEVKVEEKYDTFKTRVQASEARLKSKYYDAKADVKDTQVDEMK